MIGSSSVLNDVRSCFPSGHELFPIVDYYIGLLAVLGKIQNHAKAEFLSDDDQISLIEAIEQFKQNLIMVKSEYRFGCLNLGTAEERYS